MTVRLTGQRLDELAALAAAATPGPWVAASTGDYNGEPIAELIAPDNAPAAIQYPEGSFSATDAAFIAAAGCEFGQAIRELQELRAALTHIPGATTKPGWCPAGWGCADGAHKQDCPLAAALGVHHPTEGDT